MSRFIRVCAVALCVMAVHAVPARPEAAPTEDIAKYWGRLIALFEETDLTVETERGRRVMIEAPGFWFSFDRRDSGTCTMLWQHIASRAFTGRPPRSVIDEGCDGSLETVLNHGDGNSLHPVEIAAIAEEMVEALKIANGLFSALVQYRRIDLPFELSFFPDPEHVAQNARLLEQLRERTPVAVLDGVREGIVVVRVNPGTAKEIEVSSFVGEMDGRPICIVGTEDWECDYRVFDLGCDGRIERHSSGERFVPFPEAGQDGMAMGMLTDVIQFLRPAHFYGITSN